MAEDYSRRHSPAIRWRVMLRIVLSATFVFVAATLVPIWLRAIIPNWLIRNVSIALLWTLLVVYAVVAPAILLAAGRAILAALRAYWRSERRTSRKRSTLGAPGFDQLGRSDSHRAGGMANRTKPATARRSADEVRAATIPALGG